MTRVRARRTPRDADELPPSTRWHRDHGRQSIEAKAASQQNLTASEEKALVKYVLRMWRIGYPLPIKYLRSLAHVIRRQRSPNVRPPNKNWPQAFCKRHEEELKPRKLKALNSSRYDCHIYDKAVEWFDIIGKELDQPGILQENVYNMDETGVLLSSLNSLKVFVGRDELRNYRGVHIQRELITAVECNSADGRYLDPLIIWPAATHQSTWTVYPTPGWHFGLSETGYTNAALSLYWIQHVFDPQTRDRANGKPRVLISDGFGTHESLEVLTFCFENNIILCRLPSHTSHKLQPYDVGVFGPLKAAYREQVEQLLRGGSNTIGKQHFTQLYSIARQVAFTKRNVRGGWSGAGLSPFNAEKVLGTISRPPIEREEVQQSPQLCDSRLLTPTTAVSLDALCQEVEKDVVALDENSKCHIQKLVNAAKQAFAERHLLHDDISLLRKQNNEKKIRQSTKRSTLGKGIVMTYKELVEARERRNEKETAKVHRAARKRQAADTTASGKKRARIQERVNGENEFKMMGLSSYCSVLHLGEIDDIEGSYIRDESAAMIKY